MTAPKNSIKTYIKHHLKKIDGLNGLVSFGFSIISSFRYVTLRLIAFSAFSIAALLIQGYNKPDGGIMSTTNHFVNNDYTGRENAISNAAFSSCITYGSPWDVSKAIYNGSDEEFRVGGQDDYPSGLFFKPDGSRMFIAGGQDRYIIEYDLSTPWDVSTASHTGDGEELPFTGIEHSVQDLFFNPGGTRLFIMGSNDDSVAEFDLSTPWDVSTATHTGVSEELSFSSLEPLPSGFFFKSDGTRLYILGNLHDKIWEYDLGTAWDISTGSLNTGEEFFIGNEITGPTDLVFRSDGSRLFVIGSSYNNNRGIIAEYDLSVAWDVSTATFNGQTEELDVHSKEANTLDLFFKPDGKRLFVVGENNDYVVEYDIGLLAFSESNPADDGSITAGEHTLIAIEGDTFTSAGSSLTHGVDYTITNLPPGLAPNLAISSNGLTGTLSFNGSAQQGSHYLESSLPTLLFSWQPSAFTGGVVPANRCDGNSLNDSTFGMNFIGSQPYITYDRLYDISVPQVLAKTTLTGNTGGMNGFAFNSDGSKLYVVGQSTGNIEMYNLSAPYDIFNHTLVSTYNISSQESAVQDIEFNDDGTKLYIIGSGGDEINQFGLPTPYDISVINYEGRRRIPLTDTAPYGMAFNDSGTKLYAVGYDTNKIYEWNVPTPYDMTTVKRDPDTSLDLAGLTPSGIAFNPIGTKMYVLSPGGVDNVYEYNLPVAFDISGAVQTNSFYIGSDTVEAFDIEFNADGSKMILLDNSTLELVEYNLLLHQFTESDPADDGSITLGENLKISLNNDIFTNAGSVLTHGVDYTINNLPNGLTPVLNIDSGGEFGQLSFTGNVTLPDQHYNNDDISGLQFTWTDSALMDGYAAGLTSGPGPVNSEVGIDFIGDSPCISYGDGYNVSEAQFISKTALTGSTESYDGFTFNDDGTRLYIAGTSGDTIEVYDLSTPYDIFSHTLSASYPVAAYQTAVQNLLFNNDGTKLYLLGLSSPEITQFSLPVAYDLSSMTLDGTRTVTADSWTQSIAFNADGSKIYAAGSFNNKIYEFDVPTPFDTTSMGTTPVDNFDTSGQSGLLTSIAFNDDGSKLYTLHASSSDTIHEFHLPIAYDISGAIYVDNFYVGGQNSDPMDLFFSNDGSKLFVLNDTPKEISLYNVSLSNFTESNPDNDGSITSGETLVIKIENDTFTNTGGILTHGVDYTISGLPNGLAPVLTVDAGGTFANLTLTGNVALPDSHFDSDDISSLQITWANSALVSNNVAELCDGAGPIDIGVGIDFIGDLPCLVYGAASDISDAEYAANFRIYNQESTSQDLAFSNDGTKVFIIGTSGREINEYTLSEPFSLNPSPVFVQNFVVSGWDTGPMGLTFNDDGSKLFFVGVGADTIYEFDLSTPYSLSPAPAFVQSFIVSEESYPTGITFNNTGTKLFVTGTSGDDVNEYSLSTAYSLSPAPVFVQNFSVAPETSPQGLAFNHNGTSLFVVGSSTGDNIWQYDLATPFSLSPAPTFVQNFSVTNEETNPTGISFNNDTTKLFVIGNIGEEINEYRLGLNEFTEPLLANDGSITVGETLNIEIANDTFTNASGTLTHGVDYTIANLPVGLVPNLSVAPDGLSVAITLTGNATDHLNANNVDSLQFAWNASAFSQGVAPSASCNGNSIADSGIPVNFFGNIPCLKYDASWKLSEASYTGPGDEFPVVSYDNGSKGLFFKPRWHPHVYCGYSVWLRYRIRPGYALGNVNSQFQWNFRAIFGSR